MGNGARELNDSRPQLEKKKWAQGFAPENARVLSSISKETRSMDALHGAGVFCALRWDLSARAEMSHNEWPQESRPLT